MAGKGIVIQITGEGESAKRALEMVQEELRATGQHAKHEASEIAESMEGVKRAFEMVGIAVGIEQAIEKLKELVTESLEYGETISDASKQTGLSAQTLSVLHYAATETGTSFEAMTGAVSKLGIALASAAAGNTKADAAFKAIGVSAKDLAHREDGLQIAFEAFRQKIGATENPVQRLALAKALLGKQGAALIPVLLDLAEGYDGFEAKAKRAGTYLSTEHAGALEANNHKLNAMKEELLGAGVALTDGMIPGLEHMFSVMGAGESKVDAMQKMGEVIARAMNAAGATVYALAAGLEELFGIAEGGTLTKGGAKDLAAAKELSEQAAKMAQYAEHGKAALQQAGSPEKPMSKPGNRVPGFEGFGDLNAKSMDPIAVARAALVEEQAKAAADRQKAADEIALAELEAQHKMMLVSDQDYFAEKLRLQNEALDAEQDSLAKKQKTLENLLKKQRGDGLLKREGGTSAEELKTQRELVQLQEQLDQIRTRRGQVNSANAAEVSAGNQAVELAGLKIAADLEKERNTGIAAQLVLLRKELDLELQRNKNAGGTAEDAAAIRATEELGETKLRLGEITEEITKIENDYRREVEELNSAADKDPRLRSRNDRKIAQLNQQEAASLRDLVAAYRELGQGMPDAEQKAADMQTMLDDLGRPDKRREAAFQKEFTDGLQSITDQLAMSAAEGKQSWADMVDSMIKDVERLAIKMALEKWVFPKMSGEDDGGTGGGLGSFFSSLFGAAGEHHLSGGQGSGMPQIVGEGGIEMWTPPQSGGNYTTTDMLKRMADKGGGGQNGGAVNFSVENRSSQPVTARQTGESFDSQLRQRVIQIVLEDHASGGPLSSIGR